MAGHKVEDSNWTDLYCRAELLMDQLPKGIEQQVGDAIKRLIHEIQLNQAELEMQNDALSKSRDALEEASRKYEGLYRNYASLFNFAPIGYLVVDRDGVINEINLAAAISLNAPRSTLTGRCITDFIYPDDQDCFYYQKLNCKKSLENNTFELKMQKADGLLFDAMLQMQSFSQPHGGEKQYNIVLEDISERVQLSSGFALQKRCLDLACNATDIGHLLRESVQLVKSYLQCDAVGIRIRDDAGNIPYQAYDGFSQAFYESESPLSLRTDQCMCIAVINGTTDAKRPFFTKNGSFYINGTSRFLATVSAEDLGTTRNACNAHGYESVMLIPIKIDNTIEGLIHVADHRENRFPLRVVEALESVGSRLGLALHQFHLQDELNKSIGELNDLSKHLLTVQEDEQRRIALELHDGCGQDLNVLKLRLKRLQNKLPAEATDLIHECDGLLTYSDKIINDLRTIAHGLKPAALDALGLSAAAKQMFREFSTYAKVQVEADIDVLDQIKDPMTQVCLFRIFQEALTNVHKHAQATWALVMASREGETLRIRIEDNGIGFDAQKQFYHAHGVMGMGLSALSLRCRMIGAELSIDSQTGKGVRMTVCLPCPHPKGKP